jgi:hypothetical protein
MPILSELKAVNVSRPKQLPPILIRRNKLIAGIHEQLEGIKAKNRGEEHLKDKTVRIKKENGETLELVKQQRLKPWWFTADNGSLVFEMKYGNKRLEFSKGKTGIEVSNLNELEKVLDMLKKAVAAGELDESLSAVAEGISRRIHKREG